MLMKLTKEQTREAILRIYTMLTSGEDENDILDEMGVTVEEYEKLKSAMFEAKAEEVRSKPIEHVYVEYMIEQLKNVTTLSDVIDNYRSTKQATAIVGAVKVRSEIIDKLITKGQEFGLIKKVPNRNEFVGGVVIANLTNQELKKQITGALGGLNDMLTKYGDKNMIDVTPGEIHRGKALPEAVLDSEEDKTTKPNKSKFKGRRNVKRTKEI